MEFNCLDEKNDCSTDTAGINDVTTPVAEHAYASSPSCATIPLKELKKRDTFYFPSDQNDSQNALNFSSSEAVHNVTNEQDTSKLNEFSEPPSPSCYRDTFINVDISNVTNDNVFLERDSYKQSSNNTRQADDRSSLQADGRTSLQVDDRTPLLADDRTSLQADDTTSMQADDRTSLQADDRTSLQADDRTSLQADDRTSLQADGRTSLQADDRTSLQADNSTYVHADDSTYMQADDSTYMQVDDRTSLQADGRTSLQADDRTSLQADDRSALQADDSTYMQADDSTYMQADDSTYMQVDDRTSLQADDSTYMQVDGRTSLQADDRTSLQADDRSSLQADDRSYLQADDRSSLQEDDSTYMQADDRTSLQEDDSTYMQADDSTYMQEDDSTYMQADDSTYMQADSTSDSNATIFRRAGSPDLLTNKELSEVNLFHTLNVAESLYTATPYACRDNAPRGPKRCEHYDGGTDTTRPVRCYRSLSEACVIQENAPALTTVRFNRSTSNIFTRSKRSKIRRITLLAGIELLKPRVHLETDESPDVRMLHNADMQDGFLEERMTKIADVSDDSLDVRMTKNSNVTNDSVPVMMTTDADVTGDSLHVMTKTDADVTGDSLHVMTTTDADVTGDSLHVMMTTDVDITDESLNVSVVKNADVSEGWSENSVAKYAHFPDDSLNVSISKNTEVPDESFDVRVINDGGVADDSSDVEMAKDGRESNNSLKAQTLKVECVFSKYDLQHSSSTKIMLPSDLPVPEQCGLTLTITGDESLPFEQSDSLSEHQLSLSHQSPSSSEHSLFESETSTSTILPSSHERHHTRSESSSQSSECSSTHSFPPPLPTSLPPPPPPPSSYSFIAPFETAFSVTKHLEEAITPKEVPTTSKPELSLCSQLSQLELESVPLQIDSKAQKLLLHPHLPMSVQDGRAKDVHETTSELRRLERDLKFAAENDRKIGNNIEIPKKNNTHIYSSSSDFAELEETPPPLPPKFSAIRRKETLSLTDWNTSNVGTIASSLDSGERVSPQGLATNLTSKQLHMLQERRCSSTFIDRQTSLRVEYRRNTSSDSSLFLSNKIYRRPIELPHGKQKPNSLPASVPPLLLRRNLALQPPPRPPSYRRSVSIDEQRLSTARYVMHNIREPSSEPSTVGRKHAPVFVEKKNVDLRYRHFSDTLSGTFLKEDFDSGPRLQHFPVNLDHTHHPLSAISTESKVTQRSSNSTFRCDSRHAAKIYNSSEAQSFSNDDHCWDVLDAKVTDSALRKDVEGKVQISSLQLPAGPTRQSSRFPHELPMFQRGVSIRPKKKTWDSSSINLLDAEPHLQSSTNLHDISENQKSAKEGQRPKSRHFIPHISKSTLVSVSKTLKHQVEKMSAPIITSATNKFYIQQTTNEIEPERNPQRSLSDRYIRKDKEKVSRINYRSMAVPNFLRFSTARDPSAIYGPHTNSSESDLYYERGIGDSDAAYYSRNSADTDSFSIVSFVNDQIEWPQEDASEGDSSQRTSLVEPQHSSSDKMPEPSVDRLSRNVESLAKDMEIYTTVLTELLETYSTMRRMTPDGIRQRFDLAFKEINSMIQLQFRLNKAVESSQNDLSGIADAFLDPEFCVYKRYTVLANNIQKDMKACTSYFEENFTDLATKIMIPSTRLNVYAQHLKELLNIVCGNSQEKLQSAITYLETLKDKANTEMTINVIQNCPVELRLVGVIKNVGKLHYEGDQFSRKLYYLILFQNILVITENKYDFLTYKQHIRSDQLIEVNEQGNFQLTLKCCPSYQYDTVVHKFRAVTTPERNKWMTCLKNWRDSNTTSSSNLLFSQDLLEQVKPIKNDRFWPLSLWQISSSLKQVIGVVKFAEQSQATASRSRSNVFEQFLKNEEEFIRKLNVSLDPESMPPPAILGSVLRKIRHYHERSFLPKLKKEYEKKPSSILDCFVGNLPNLPPLYREFIEVRAALTISMIDGDSTRLYVSPFQQLAYYIEWLYQLSCVPRYHSQLRGQLDLLLNCVEDARVSLLRMAVLNCRMDYYKTGDIVHRGSLESRTKCKRVKNGQQYYVILFEEAIMFTRLRMPSYEFVQGVWLDQVTFGPQPDCKQSFKIEERGYKKEVVYELKADTVPQKNVWVQEIIKLLKKQAILIKNKISVGIDPGIWKQREALRPVNAGTISYGEQSEC